MINQANGPVVRTLELKSVHTEKYFRNIVDPNQIWIVISLSHAYLAPIGIAIGATSFGKG